MVKIAGSRIDGDKNKAKSRVKRMVKKVNHMREQTAAPLWIPPYS